MILPDNLADLDAASLVNEEHVVGAMGARGAYIDVQWP